MALKKRRNRDDDRVITYHAKHSFVSIEGEIVNFSGELLGMNIFFVVKNKEEFSGVMAVDELIKFEKTLKLLEKDEEITDLKFEEPVRLMTLNGMYVKIDQSDN